VGRILPPFFWFFGEIFLKNFYPLSYFGKLVSMVVSYLGHQIVFLNYYFFVMMSFFLYFYLNNNTTRVYG
jgi:hypothetical protein